MLRISNNATTSESFCVLSHPIRIVSKIDHIRKEGVPIKKKTFNEILTDRLRELETMQEEQTQLIKSMFAKGLAGLPGLPAFAVPEIKSEPVEVESPVSPPPAKKPKVNKLIHQPHKAPAQYLFFPRWVASALPIQEIYRRASIR